jgi:nitroreductase
MIRAFSSKQISDESLYRILELAQHYPSAGFSQEVSLVVVTDAKLKQQIRRARDLRTDSPVFIIPCVSEQVLHARYKEIDKIRNGKEIDWPIPFWYFDVGCASMIILLAAVNEGLAASFAGMEGIFKPSILREILGIPEDYEPIGIISLGYADFERDEPSSSLKRGRMKFEKFVHINGW